MVAINPLNQYNTPVEVFKGLLAAAAERNAAGERNIDAVERNIDAVEAVLDPNPLYRGFLMSKRRMAECVSHDLNQLAQGNTLKLADQPYESIGLDGYQMRKYYIFCSGQWVAHLPVVFFSKDNGQSWLIAAFPSGIAPTIVPPPKSFSPS